MLLDATYPVLRLRDGAIVREDVPALSALNMRLRDDYVDDANAGVDALEPGDRARRVRVPPRAAACRVQPPDRRVRRDPCRHRRQPADGRRMAARARRRCCRLPTTTAFVASLMRPVHRARRLRLLDRAAPHRHRQQARRLRIREDTGMIALTAGTCITPQDDDASTPCPRPEPAATRCRRRCLLPERSLDPPVTDTADTVLSTMMTAIPLSRTRRIVCQISSRISGARPSVASSRISSLGLVISARPIASICCSPPESSLPRCGCAAAGGGTVASTRSSVHRLPPARGETQILQHDRLANTPRFSGTAAMPR